MPCERFVDDIDENALALQATQVRDLVEAVLAQPDGPGVRPSTQPFRSQRQLQAGVMPLG